MPNTYTLSVSSGLGLQPTTSAYVSPIVISVSSGLGIQAVATANIMRTHTISVSANLGVAASIPVLLRNTTYFVSVSSGLGLQPILTTQALRTYAITVSSGLAIQPTLSLLRNTTYSLSVSSGLGVQASIPTFGANHTYNISVASGLGLSPSATLTRTYQFAVSSGLGIQAVATSAATRNISVSSTLGIQPTATAPRTITISVSSGLGLQPSTGQSAGLYGFSLATGLGIQTVITLAVGTTSVSANFNLQATVSVTLEPPNTLGTPGVSPFGGPSVKLLQGISGSYPLTFCETPSGIVLAANGVDPMIRWDSLSMSADFAGVIAPTTAPTATTSGLGTITGIRYCFCRFIDAAGNPSNLSPLGGPIQCGHDQSLDDITLNASTGSVVVTARSHGLTTGSQILLQGVNGLPLGGQYAITVTDQDHFTLNGVILSQGAWSGGGALTVGVATITYANIPLPSQSRVTQVQILRNLEGTADVLYVDAVLYSASGTNATTATSTFPDEVLSRQQAVTLRSSDGFPLGLRYSPPPSNRPFLVNYMGRVFAAGDVVYYAGCVAVTSGQNIIQGIGTQWTQSFVGRRIYVKGASKSYGIVSVNSNTQVAILDSTYLDSTQLFATYFIRSSTSDRKTLNWSEPDNPEAWPPWNGLAIPEDNDEVTGLFTKGTFLFVAERRHLWRFQFVDDPAKTGHIFLTAERGSLNHRTTVLADDKAFLMDESGIYAFDGSATEPISQPIQNMFQQDGLAPTFQVDWSQDTTLWHASLDPIRTIIRWFVAFVGQVPLTTAICFNYRLQRWWTETYPVAITSSCTGTIAEAANVGIPSGYRRALVGAECRMVLCLGQGALDIMADVGPLRGTVSQATSVSLTDSTASFAPYLGGAPITIVSGTGAGQTRIISANTATQITVVQAWATIPDTTSQYQIGGVSWQWRSGWMDVEDQESETARDFIVSFQPMTNPVQFTANFLYDHNTSPIVWAYDRELDGVSVNTGDPNIYFDMTSSDVIPGWRVFRQGHHTERYAYSDRFIQVLLAGVSNDQTVRIYQTSIRGVDNEGL